MRDFKFLKLLDMFQPIFHKLGVDFPVMRKILQVKLLMDGRRVPTVFNGSSNNNKKDSDNKFLMSLGIYLLMGLILIPFVFMKSNYIFQMSIEFVILMFFIMTTLISDFSSVLLDIKDKNIIGAKPVDPKTLRLAKTLHISYYMFSITAALVGPALLVSLYRQGFLFFLIFLILIILMDLFIIVLTSIVYLFILRFFDGEKLKDMINYIQIILSVVLMVGYQFLARLFQVVDLKVQFVPKWWQYLIPPVWFSAPFQMLKKSEVNFTYILFTIMAIVIPVIAIAVYLKLMPLFENNLQKLGNNSDSSKHRKRNHAPRLSYLLCRGKEERVYFRFASDMMKTEREFKLKVYPSLGFSLVFPFIYIFQQISEAGLKEVSKGRSYLFIYFCGMMLPAVLSMMRYSATYKGAWIYKALPIGDLTPVFRGTMKAFIMILFFPMFFLETIIFTVIFGIRIIPDMLLVFLNMMLFNILFFIINEKTLPFSEAFEASKQVNGALNFLLAIGLAIMAGVHYLFTNLNYGVYIYLLLALIANLLLWRYAFRIPQEKLRKA